MGKRGIIPILFNHNPQKVIGKVEIESHSLLITFIDEFKVTKKNLFKMVNGGIVILESYIDDVDKIIYIKRFRLFELSIK